MKKFFIFLFAALLVTGCQKNKANSPNDLDAKGAWDIPTRGAVSEEATPESAPKVEAKAETEVAESEPVAKPEPPAPVAQPAAKTEPQPAVRQPAPQPAPRLKVRGQPAPKRQPEPVTRSVPMGPSRTPGVILRNARTVTYRPAYATWNAGYMFQFENRSSRFMWVSTTGHVTMQPLVGQCMESPRLPPVPRPEACPFVELQTKTGSWVVLIKPGYKAMFVIDTETCPPDGSGCRASVQAIPYSMEVEPRPERNRRQVRNFEFPKSPKGWRWYL